MKEQFDVIVIGGGSTGAGVARDCSLRGLKTLLLERSDISTGATGRNHGLLHSGARYAVNDAISAEECIVENKILRRIAHHCIEDTQGLFVTLEDDDLDYQQTFVEACQHAGIDAHILDPKEAIRMEPSVNRNIKGAVQVPDGAVDPFRLTLANVMDAAVHGAKICTYHELKEFVLDNGRVVGVKAYDHNDKSLKTYYSQVVVNAAGIWGSAIAEKLGIRINMFPAKGSLLIFDHRVNKMVLNRCRKPADADILVPGDTICLIGTTSTKVPFEEVDRVKPTLEEVDILMKEARKLAPTLDHTRILRAYAGVRPLVASDDDPTGRSVSRGITLLDHAQRDGIEGFISVVGGKLMTYRLMAEMATDLVCKKLNVNKACETAKRTLIGSDLSSEEALEGIVGVPVVKRNSIVGRHGDLAKKISSKDHVDNSIVCECEGVSVGEIKYAIEELNVCNLLDLRRRTRISMGTCQGELCICRAAALLGNLKHECIDDTKNDMCNFLQERWKGTLPVSWGDGLREAEFTSWVYKGICGLSIPESESIKSY